MFSDSTQTSGLSIDSNASIGKDVISSSTYTPFDLTLLNDTQTHLSPWLWGGAALLLAGGAAAAAGGSSGGGSGHDSVAPPTVTLLQDTGISVSDNLTHDATLNSSAPPTGTVRTYSLNGGVATTNYTAPVTDGTYTVMVTDTNAAGNSASASITFILDTSIDTPVITLDADTGVSNTDRVTQIDGYTLSPAAADVTRVVGEGGGSSSENLGQGFTKGIYVTDTDKAGNSITTEFIYVVDTFTPTPVIQLQHDNGILSNDLLTNNAALNVGIMSMMGLETEVQPNVTRTYSINGGAASSTYTAPTADGNYTVLVTDLDTAGNSASTSITFTLDTTIATPTVQLSHNTGNNTSDTLTKDASLTVNAEPAADVTRTYSINGGAASNTYTAPSRDGDYTVVITDTDNAGNTATASISFTLDVTIDTPTVALTLDSGVSQTDHITNAATLNVSATAADVTRTYSLDGNAASSSYTAPTAAEDGIAHTVLIIDTDAAGNSASNSITFTLDNIAPVDNLAITLEAADDTGISNSDHYTNNPLFTVYSNNGNLAGKQFIIDNGAPIAADSFNPNTMSDGEHTLSVFVSDVAGNTNTSAPFTYTIDRTIAKPTVSFDPTSSNAADLTATFPTLNEDSKAADIVTREYSITTDSGTLFYRGSTYLTPEIAGFYSLQVTDTDKAGNTATSTPFDFYVSRSGVGNTATDANNSDTVFIAGDGADWLYGRGGVDQFYAGSGNDVIYIDANNLAQIQAGATHVYGGEGLDKLYFEDYVNGLNFSTLVGHIHSIEVLEMGGINGGAANVVTLDESTAAAISDIGAFSQSGLFNSTVLDPTMHQIAVSSNATPVNLFTNWADWTLVGTATNVNNNAVYEVYNSLNHTVQLLW